MKILWHSNAPWSVSGYGNQTAMWVPKFADLGHEVAINCFYGLEGATIAWPMGNHSIRCYPTDPSRFGNLLLGEYADHFGEGDRSQVTVLTLMDVWVMMQGVSNFQDLRFVCWTPVDHDPAPPMVIEFLKAVNARVIAMSRFGQDRLQQQHGLDAGYVPLAVDTTKFFPDPANRDNYRDGLNIPRDAFVVGMVAHNQGLPPRKSFPQVFAAFAEFQKRHEEAILYLHSDIAGRNNGVVLPPLAELLGIPPESIRTTNQLMLHLGIPSAQMNGIYNAFDALAAPSMGEGFGIPIIEAQAAGCPVITTDFTSMPELLGSGWLVTGEKFYDASQRSYQMNPNVQDILNAMEESYAHARDWEIREKAREFASGYDTEHVFETYWKPTLEELQRPIEIEPLRLAA